MTLWYDSLNVIVYIPWICVYIYIYCLPWILYVENTHVWLCFCVLYWNHQVLVPSSYSFACLIGLGGRDLVPQCNWCPRFGTANSGFGYFGNHQRFSIQYSSKFNFLSATRGASIMPYMVHPSMLNVGYPWHRVPFSVPSNPNGSSYESKISTSLMIFRKIWSARILPNNSTRHAWPPQGTCCTEMDLECHMCLGIYFWITGDWEKKTLQAGCSFNPQNKTLKGSQFQGKFASTELRIESWMQIWDVYLAPWFVVLSDKTKMLTF